MGYKVNQESTTGFFLAVMRQYRGLQSRVARNLGVSRQYVSAVANGRKKSPKVVKALESEYRRIERSAKRRAA